MPPPPGPMEVDAVTDTQGVTIPDPLTRPIRSNEILGRRKAPPKTQWGVAAAAHSSSFRQGPSEGKPKARRWDHRFTEESLARKGSQLKGAAKYLGNPGLISLGGGLPSSEYFPFSELSLKLPVPGHFEGTDFDAHATTVSAGKHDLAQGKSIFDIATAFNYGQGTGAAQLLRWLTEHTELVHRPPYADWACTMSVGATSAFDMALRMFTRPGDAILSEEFTFASALDTATPMGLHVVGVSMDQEGLLPDSLDAILSGWDPAARGGASKPFILYTVPTGQNPTGATQSARRRRDIYRVAREHDLFILEDEPYYFLQMQPYVGTGAREQRQAPPPPRSHDEFLASLVPSYLSMDTDGRVMRMDSFSKVVAPGSRVGWITASEQVVEKYKMHADVSTQCPSGMSQLILFKLLEEHWGHGGYLDWLIHLRLEYTGRRDNILEACEKYLPKEVVSWVPPAAGMFHWMRIDYAKHPRYPAKSVTQLEDELFMASIAHGSLVMRGSWFLTDRSVEPDQLFFRATYAAAPADKIQEAIRRFGEALRESFGLEGGGGGGGEANGSKSVANGNGV
ncbi:pyridoxal phosphate-dependent transferase [Lineolata rhizophorae]|uniref:aromatic-amino-acid transaminase n=1 Tax=Lineolata rhizophorae TaxID=578093 RepID=A0A6A6P7P6_9PEZI|nr:pyridoxal phosphate-dependent transferase [Lineolata rhizophorae]